MRTISVGRPQDKEWAGLGRTSIDKRAVGGPVEVHPLGIEGDQVSDTQHHGGLDQAVYAYAREDLDFWEQRLGMPIRDGQFGENLTTEGIDVNALEIGSRLRVGLPGVGVLLEAVAVRIPCNDFKGWMGRAATTRGPGSRGSPRRPGRGRTSGCWRPAGSHPATRSRWCTRRGTA